MISNEQPSMQRRSYVTSVAVFQGCYAWHIIDAVACVPEDMEEFVNHQQSIRRITAPDKRYRIHSRSRPELSPPPFRASERSFAGGSQGSGSRGTSLKSAAKNNLLTGGKRQRKCYHFFTIFRVFLYGVLESPPRFPFQPLELELLVCIVQLFR
jgi:hypothetical protein